LKITKVNETTSSKNPHGVFYVLDCEGIVDFGEEKETEKDSIVHSPAKIIQCWCNKSENLLQILVAKTLKPKRGNNPALIFPN